MGMMLYVLAIPALGLALVASAVAEPSPLQRIPPRVDRRGDPARVRSAGRSCEPKASPATHRFGASTGDGRRLPRNGCWPRPQTMPSRRRRAAAAGDSEATSRDQGGRQSSRGGPLPTAAKAAGRRLRNPPRRQRKAPAASDPGSQASGRWPGFRGPDARRHRSRRADRDRLVQVAAGRAVAPADRTGLVVLRRRRRRPLHAGAARRRRGRRRLQGEHRRAGVAAPRRGALLGVEWRRRSARDADAQPRPRLHVRRDRHRQRARRRAPAPSSGRATRRPTPAWKSRAGASPSSPLVVDDLVVVAASGRLVAYDAATGEPRWFGPTGGGGYSSPHLATIDGVAADPAAEGKPHDQRRAGRRQPALGAHVGSGRRHRAAGSGGGRRRPDHHRRRHGRTRHAPPRGRARPARRPGWTVEERWTSRGLKPYFNDFVVHKGHAFGFDGSILSCIDLADGKRKWKGGRYGHGQLVLLPDQDLLLVLSEDGELALVSATPDQFTEVARFPAHRGQDLEPPGARRRRPAGSQRRGDGRVPVVPRAPLTMRLSSG